MLGLIFAFGAFMYCFIMKAVSYGALVVPFTILFQSNVSSDMHKLGCK